MQRQVPAERGPSCPLVRALVRGLAERGEVELLAIGATRRTIRWSGVDEDALVERLAARNLTTPEVLAERALAGIDLDAEAESLGLSADQVLALHRAAVDALAPEARAEMEKALAHPRGKGQIDPESLEALALLKRLRIEGRLIDQELLKTWVAKGFPWIFVPRGPIHAVDHRPKFGPARNQSARPTCTAFGATVVAEGLEALRDRRAGPIDLSEEFLWWYSKEGQKITAGGYDCRAALHHYEANGVCAEHDLPYWTRQIGSNHAHVPVPDGAIDRAPNHRQPPYANLPARDVDALKDVLRSGRCAALVSGTTGWNTATGVVTFPADLDSMGVGASHCTAVIGFIDRNDLPAHFEGGYFIIRNSWGGAGSTSHSMGPEYGGHLLMPYGWYRRYTWGASTLGPLTEAAASESASTWHAEYFDNRSLRGTPAKTDSVADVDFDWGSGGPLATTITIPFLGDFLIGQTNDFSARFTSIRRMREGWYRFTLRGDDGVRLWVDDRLVINGWRNQAETSYTAEHYVTGGDHVLRIEYYEAGGVASLDLDVEAIAFHYELFTGETPDANPVTSFDDTMTDLEWRHASPLLTFGGTFSLRGVAQKHFAAGTYRFHARHTGGCRIWVDDELVLDDWDGLSGSGAPVTLSGGTKTVRVEFANRATYPAPGVKDFYRAALAFEWSEEAWHAELHEDPAREVIQDDGWPEIDSEYEAYVTQSLTGAPKLTYAYSETRPVGATYLLTDLPNAYSFRFPDAKSFGNGIPGGAALPDDARYLSAHLHRRLHLAQPGRYVLSVRTDEAFRLSVDGVQLLEQRRGGSDTLAAEVDLPAGVHDVAIEYANTKWGTLLRFDMKRTTWQVDYYDGADFQAFAGSRQLDDLAELVPQRPTSVGSTTWSARARRTLTLPVGRYRLYVRTQDDVRVYAGGQALIDTSAVQDAVGDSAHVEHRGGPLPIEVEYRQELGGAVFELAVESDGFLAEYYRGIQLEDPPGEGGKDRNPPVAYRFEPTIDFDWGHSGRLPRMGADEFSARFWGIVELPVGRWRFRVLSDDGVRLFLDDRVLVDSWTDQPKTEKSVVVDLPPGRREVRLEYYERKGSAACRLAVERVY